ncbi:MAG TPA: hypothetical protein VF571_01665 [Pyrinomonadaceae bacterium]|jgi:multisubunit Na+/H+ antiporter MnhB subunit
MKDAIYVILALISAGIAAYFMYGYVNTATREQRMMDLIISVICILIAIVFGGLFLAGRVNKEEEIHITK